MPMTRPYFHKYAGSDGKWYWRLRAANNETVAQGEGYNTEAGVDQALQMLKDFGSDLERAEIITVSRRLPNMRGGTKTLAIQKAATNMLLLAEKVTK